MKKIFTLILSVTLVGSAFAQYGKHDNDKFDRNKDVVVYQHDNDNGRYDNDRYDKDRFGKYNFTKREMEIQIAQINRNYDAQVRAVRSKFFMSRAKKEMALWSIESQRKAEIKKVQDKFYDRRNTFGDKKRNW